MTQSSALTLVVQGTTTPVAYACPKCGQVFACSSGVDGLRALAEKHCTPKLCKCGAPKTLFRGCTVCVNKELEEKELLKFQKAGKESIQDYEDPLYWGDHLGDLGEGYFSGVDELLDYCEGQELAVPEYVWACKRQVLTLNASDLIDDALIHQEFNESVGEGISDAARDKLQQLIDGWIGEQNVHGWMCDESRAILLREDAVGESRGSDRGLEASETSGSQEHGHSNSSCSTS